MVKGMKQTEIGWIPEDWEMKQLGYVIDVYRGGSPRPIQDYITKKSNGINWIKIGDTSATGKYIYSVSEKITPEGEIRSRRVYPGDFLLSNSMSFGRPYILKIEGCIHDGWLVLQNYSTSFDSEFLYYLLSSKVILDQYYSKAAGSSVLNLNKELVSSVYLLVPTLPEQEAIAGALSDADAWIESLEQLIAKKRLIKQGAMQELLTPKEGWEVKSIFEIADSKRDLFNDGDWIESEHIVDEGIRLVQTGNIGIGKFLNKANRKYINELSFNKLKCKELREGDLLICRLAEPAGRACLFPKTDDYKSVTSVDVTIYRPDVQKYDRRFLLFSLSTDQWFTDVIEQVGGTTHKRISRGNLGRIKISVPSLTEQTRIATILSDMDAELEALEQQLHKARQIKQGMMQELLTGRIRLLS